MCRSNIQHYKGRNINTLICSTTKDTPINKKNENQNKNNNSTSNYRMEILLQLINWTGL
ncbi:hypothetical protein Syun_018528 [Stephania yunnanensis]|uniref:Uncharacterized protein n=1 Tax=Stephania yunnanensis TaxID=152371 RepID=A0AAP0NYH0_9MAGN